MELLLDMCPGLKPRVQALPTVPVPQSWDEAAEYCKKYHQDDITDDEECAYRLACVLLYAKLGQCDIGHTVMLLGRLFKWDLEFCFFLNNLFAHYVFTRMYPETFGAVCNVILHLVDVYGTDPDNYVQGSGPVLITRRLGATNYALFCEIMSVDIRIAYVIFEYFEDENDRDSYYRDKCTMTWDEVKGLREGRVSLRTMIHA